MKAVHWITFPDSTSLLPSIHQPLLGTLLAFVSLLPLLYFLNLWLLSPHSKKLPPGSLGLPLLGESLHFLYYVKTDRAHLFTHVRRQRYGNVFKSHVFGKPYVFVSGAKAAKMMAFQEHKAFQAYQFQNSNLLLGPHSLLVIYGEPHRRFRQLTNDQFSPDGLRASAGMIADVALDVFKDWEVGQTHLIEEAAAKFTLNVIAAFVLSWMPGHLTEKAAELSRILMHGMIRAPINMPGFAYHKAVQARRDLVELFEQEIEQRKTSGQKAKNDILQSLLDSEVSTQEITDNLITFILAGHETSTSTISFIVQHLSEKPEMVQKVREECEAIYRSKSPTKKPVTWEDLKKMDFTEKVVNEGARIASVVFWWHRNVAQDCEFQGYHIPRGWRIVFDIRGTHDMPEYFPHPSAFNPSRFDSPTKPYSFLPFGCGSKACLGMNLAKLEMTIFVYHLVLNFRWRSLLPNTGVSYYGLPRPKGGVPILIEEKRI